MSIAIKLGQIWTDGSSKYRIMTFIGNKAYATNLDTKRIQPFVYLNADYTPVFIAECWKLVPGLPDPPTKFIIPSRELK